MFDPTAFSSAFDLPEIQPAPEDPPAEEQNPDTGPWISHGTIHLGFKPRH